MLALVRSNLQPCFIISPVLIGHVDTRVVLRVEGPVEPLGKLGSTTNIWQEPKKNRIAECTKLTHRPVKVVKAAFHIHIQSQVMR